MSDASLIGITLASRFRVTGVIGEGGMATVYKAQQDVEPHDVAIKVMNPDLAKDTRFVRRFRREAKAASMLKHPNTVSILEFGVDQGFVFLAMECLEGHDLALLLHRERRITELRAVHILIQVCKALSAAHELSIVHRDLKPDNIMLVKLPKGVEPSLAGMSANDFVKVLDFGIAKILDEDDTKGTGADPRAEPITSAKSMLTRVGTIVGTPAYMAPEQGRAEPVDGRTDVYACGVLLYELLTGRVPFSGETPMQVVMRHVNEAPEPPSKFIPVEPSLERVIMKSLAKYPAERQQSAADLAAELTALLPRLATEKRQPGDASAPSSVIIGAAAAAPAPQTAAPRIAAGLPPPPPASGAMAPPPVAPTGVAASGGAAQAAQGPRPAAGKPPPNPLEGSTLVMEPGPPPKASPAAPPTAASNPHKPVTGGAPAFPTLNIDVPADMMADIDAKLAAGSASASAPPTVQKAPAQPAAKFPPARPIDNAVDSDDDVRTLVAHDVPATRQSLANIPAPYSEDDPRTMLAVGRGGPSIPDLSQPLGGLPGAPAVGGDKSTTLVSALTGEGGTAASRANPAPSTLKAMKGTAKMDPVEIQVAQAAGQSPTTQPSHQAVALDATQALGTAQTMSSGPAAKEHPKAAVAMPKPAEPEVLPVARVEASPSPVLPAPDVPALAVWQPKRRRLTGPVAMMLGILIGALLFAIVFAALFLIKPQ